MKGSKLYKDFIRRYDEKRVKSVLQSHSCVIVEKYSVESIVEEVIPEDKEWFYRPVLNEDGESITDDNGVEVLAWHEDADDIEALGSELWKWLEEPRVVDKLINFLGEEYVEKIMTNDIVNEATEKVIKGEAIAFSADGITPAVPDHDRSSLGEWVTDGNSSDTYYSTYLTQVIANVKVKGIVLYSIECFMNEWEILTIDKDTAEEIYHFYVDALSYDYVDELSGLEQHEDGSDYIKLKEL